ncbi:MAG TPA: TetR family transcriptional regulator [Solirubrobacteraceae bacterium]|nr:TetR family transcriptional regulator [Solirubrobacteraceae bacterium]
MPPRQRARRAPRDQTRRDVLDAAARAFARDGFHGASVEAVAAEAGLTTGAVYSNFKSKEELFLTLYEERIALRAKELRAAAVGGGVASAAADATRLFRRDREWLLLYFEFALHAARDPAFARRFRALRRRGLDELARGIEEGLRAAGGDPAAAPELARAVRAAGYGFALEHLLGEARGADAALEGALRRLLGSAL